MTPHSKFSFSIPNGMSTIISSASAIPSLGKKDRILTKSLNFPLKTYKTPKGSNNLEQMAEIPAQ